MLHTLAALALMHLCCAPHACMTAASLAHVLLGRVCIIRYTRWSARHSCFVTFEPTPTQKRHRRTMTQITHKHTTNYLQATYATMPSTGSRSQAIQGGGQAQQGEFTVPLLDTCVACICS